MVETIGKAVGIDEPTADVAITYAVEVEARAGPLLGLTGTRRMC
jgi:hypothetical protein